MSRLLVGTADGLHDLTAGTVELAGRDVGVVIADAAGWWALTGQRSLWRRTAEWAEVARAPADVVALGVEGGDVVLGGSKARLWRWDGDRLSPVPSFERAPTSERWTTPWGGAASVRTMALTPDAWYVNVHVGGILRSPDRGGSWEPTIDLDVDVHQVLVAPDGSLLAANGSAGLARSTDRGGTWDHDTGGLHGSYSRAVTVVDGTVLLSASSGPGGRRAAVYRRPLTGRGFVRCEQGLPEWFGGNIDSGWLASDGTRAALATPDGSVYESEDRGERWVARADGLPRPSWVTYAP